MKQLSKILFLGLFIIARASTAQNNPDAITGTWDADERTVEVYKSGVRFIGNPIGPDGNRIEKVEILNLEYKDGKWMGKLYAEKRDRTFDVECEMENASKLLLEVDLGMISKGFEWTRIK